jgi:muramoyltetrapeptide carboxypeptidase LdcA involved in peptidoglycan recycling
MQSEFMKIGLVNLAKFKKYKNTPNYKDDISFLKENSLDFVDYCSSYDKEKDLLQGFYSALKNPEIGIVWFVCGGEKLIKFLDKIDWKLVKKSNKAFIGTSDFTHFAFKVAEINQPAYYGNGLKNIKLYHSTKKSRQYMVDFLRTGKVNKYKYRNLFKKVDNLNNEKIVGGHLLISTFMLGELKINLSNRYLFIEHHYIPGEKLIDLEFFFDQLKMRIKHNKPKGFILGHTILYDKNGKRMNIGIINKKIVGWLKEYNKPIAYLDHFNQVIKFS